MTDHLMAALQEQLEDESSIIFKERDYYFHVYEAEDHDFGYDVYTGMDEYDPYDGGVCNGSARDALLFVMDTVPDE